MCECFSFSFKLNAFIKSENVDSTDDIFHQWQSFLFKQNLEEGSETFYHSSDTHLDFLGIIQRVVINVENVKPCLYVSIAVWKTALTNHQQERPCTIINSRRQFRCVLIHSSYVWIDCKCHPGVFNSTSTSQGKKTPVWHPVIIIICTAHIILSNPSS